MGFIAGVDEAGRGPVIGPMAMAIVACKDEELVRKLGMKDSKLLTSQQREQLAEVLKAHDGILHELILLSPAEIDAAVTGKAGGDSLNALEARTTALLISRIAKRVPISEVILDSPTRTTANYERAVRAALARIDPDGVTQHIKLTAECKADFNHPVVGAASILAKTARDAEIAALSATHGKLGSGYPSDPDTQAFLHAHWREPHDFFRKSWESYRRLAESGTQSSLAAFEEKKEEHAQTLKAFEQLLAHGYAFLPPTNPYEVVRMKNDAGVTIISYTTGKLVVQGPDAVRAQAERLLESLGLAAGKVESKRPRGRPKKQA